MRRLNNWLRAYLEYTRETESSDQFHYWTAISVLGAITKRQVWLDFDYFKIFPNHYIILVGPPAARKSIATRIGVDIADSVGIRRFSDKITGAALIRDLSESTEKKVQTNEVELYSPMLIYASELGVFLGPDAYGSGVIADLTDLYDCPAKWEKKTIARDSETIIAPYISLLAATTPQTLKDCLPPGAVGQGFTSRIIFVWASQRRKRVPIPSWGSEHTMLQGNLVNDLKHIMTLHGSFTFSPAGLQVYKEYYMGHPEPEEAFEDERLRAYAARKDVHMLKLAMCLSLADKDELILTEREISGAIESFNWLDQGLPAVFASQGRSASSEDVIRVYRQIESATKRIGWITHGDLVKRNYNQLSSTELEVVIKTLQDAGAVTEVVSALPGSRVATRNHKCLDFNFIKKAKQFRMEEEK